MAVETVLATVATSVVTTGVGLAVNAALKPKQKESMRDEGAPTQYERGKWIPHLIGRHRVGPFVAWLGHMDPLDNADGWAYQPALHVLCVGIGARIHAIYEDDQIIWGLRDDPDNPGGKIPNFPLNPIDNPSGEEVMCDNGKDSFRVYWGNTDDPVDDLVSSTNDGIGVKSRFPWMFKVAWTTPNPHAPHKMGKRLPYHGTAWGNITYEVSANLNDDDLDFMIDATVNGAGKSREDDGVNPAKALHMLLTAPFPFGMALPAASIDGGALNALTTLLATEHLPCNVLAQDGVTGGELVGRLMEDFGFLIVQHRTELLVMPVRAGASVATLTDDMIDGLPEESIIHELTLPDVPTFMFRDRKRRYADQPAFVRNDSRARMTGQTSQAKTVMQTVTDRHTGHRVAARRSMESVAFIEPAKLGGLRDFRNAVAGQLVTLPNGKQYRVVSVKPEIATARAEVELVMDSPTFAAPTMTPEELDDVFGEEPEGPGQQLSAAPDIALKCIEVPFEIMEEDDAALEVAVFRVRAHDSITRGRVYLKSNDDYVRRDARQDIAAVGGTLNSPLPADTPNIVTVGPSITSFHAGSTYDYDGMRDQLLTTWLSNVSSDPGTQPEYDEWQGGYVVMVIGTEWMSIANVVQVSGGYELRGIIRGMYGTTVGSHAAGDKVFILARNQMRRYAYPGFVQGPARCRTQPGTADAYFTPLDDNPSVAVDYVE